MERFESQSNSTGGNDLSSKEMTECLAMEEDHENRIKNTIIGSITEWRFNLPFIQKLATV